MYYVFDLLKLGNVDLRSEPLLKRKKTLERILKGRSPRLIYLDHIQREGLAMFAGALALGMEGIVGKDAKSMWRGLLRIGFG